MFYCLTFDIWASRTTDSFLALTMHFVSADFDLKSYTLTIARFPGKHTGVRIADLVLSLMQKWELDALRLIKIVGDNGSNVIKAYKEMDVNHFGCIAHSLHLVDDVERELESASMSGSASIEFNAESVDLETDDCLDKGMLDGWLSDRAAARIMDVMKLSQGHMLPAFVRLSLTSTIVRNQKLS